MEQVHRKRNPEIIAEPPSALRVIALSIGIELDEARAIVRALAKAGFVVAPMEPTNSMFGAYMEALRMPPKRFETVIRNVGKARLRWKAMAKAGIAVAFSEQALVDQLDGHLNSTQAYAGSSPAERATIECPAVHGANGAGDSATSNHGPGC